MHDEIFLVASLVLVRVVWNRGAKRSDWRSDSPWRGGLHVNATNYQSEAAEDGMSERRGRVAEFSLDLVWIWPFVGETWTHSRGAARYTGGICFLPWPKKSNLTSTSSPPKEASRLTCFVSDSRCLTTIHPNDHFQPSRQTWGTVEQEVWARGC
jgi:hypothetical protein